MIVEAMYAVVSVAGSMTPQPIETECILAIQRHLLRCDPPVAGAPGPLPEDLAEIIDTPELQLMTVRILALLPVMDRRLLPEKIGVVAQAAARLGVAEVGLDILRHVARERYRRVALIMAKRFIACWSPAGKARLRDWVKFLWWMTPRLHTPNMARNNRELLGKFQALASLPEGTFGRTLHDFFAANEIPLPGARKSLPLVTHEVYHVLCEYGVSLEGELLLTAFSGGTMDETCLDQLLIGLFAYQAGKRIFNAAASEGILQPDDYFRAIARGAALNVNIVSGWDLWAVADVPAAELRSRYNLPPIPARERESIMSVNALLTGPGYSTPALA